MHMLIYEILQVTESRLHNQNSNLQFLNEEDMINL